MRTMMVSMLCCGFLISADDTWQTSGVANGRLWQSQSNQSKLSYLEGLADSNLIGCNDVVQRAFPKHMLYGEIVKALDSFYEDATNLIVPVPLALMYVKDKADGMSPDALKRIETEIRKTANTLKEP